MAQSCMATWDVKCETGHARLYMALAVNVMRGHRPSNGTTIIKYIAIHSAIGNE